MGVHWSWDTWMFGRVVKVSLKKKVNSSRWGSEPTSGKRAFPLQVAVRFWAKNGPRVSQRQARNLNSSNGVNEKKWGRVGVRRGAGGPGFEDLLGHCSVPDFYSEWKQRLRQGLKKDMNRPDCSFQRIPVITMLTMNHRRWKHLCSICTYIILRLKGTPKGR